MRLKDISEKAGVAISTVSRVLSDPTSSAASQETKDLIFKIALEGGYISQIPEGDSFETNYVPTALPPKTLYCMLAVDPQEYDDSPFFSRLMSSIRNTAAHYNYIVEFYFPSRDNPESLTAPFAKENTVRGIIVIGRFLPAILGDLKERFKNIVYIGLTDLKNADCDQVICEGYKAAQAAVKCFHDHGHKYIAFIGTNDDDRSLGYKAALKDLNLPKEAYLLQDSFSMSINGGYEGMKKLLSLRDKDHPVTAVFCASDKTAIGALQACKEQGIRVPEDISLMGMDDSEMTRYLTPSLSTIHVPLEEMGKFSIRVLRDRMHGGHTYPIRVSFPFFIQKRDSGPALLS